jgi:hypothetical protein
MASGFSFGDLVVSRTVYEGTASTVTKGQTLPGGGTAAADGTYPYVFNNNLVDGSFGVTSPIFLDTITPTGTFVSTYAVPTNQMVTSFSSKSELALNFSTDNRSLTLMGYVAGTNQLDVSNSNTPGIIEPGNPVTTPAKFRAVYQLDSNGNALLTTTNAYPGNNPRAAIYDKPDNQYLAAGNAGNGNGSAAVTAATGVQIITPGQNASANTPGTTKVGNFNITQYGYKPDKSAKDNNYRGETIFNDTLYVTKGSGGNGINTVYQVGSSGTLPTSAGNPGNTPITILPGFPTGLAKADTFANGTATLFFPFGIWFANATTLYVGDEGDGSNSGADIPTANPHAGLEKWSLVNGTWQLDYTLQNGLQLGVPYTPAGYPTGINKTTAQGGEGGTGKDWQIETDGIRNITGKVNGDGTVTLYGITSTVSGSGDQGADPNRLVAITDTLSDTTAANEEFTTLYSAKNEEVLRGVAFDVLPEPGTWAMLLLGGGVLGASAWRARRLRILAAG